MPEHVDHYWVGEPAAVTAALEGLGWRPLLGLASPVVAPILAWGEFTEASIGGHQLGMVLFRASECITPPQGVAHEPGPFLDAGVGRFAALDPVPTSLTLLQFMRMLARRGIVTEAEAMAATKYGDVPAAIDGVFAAFPPAAAFDARLTWAGMYMVERANPLLALVGSMNGLDAAAWDDIFTEGAAT